MENREAASDAAGSYSEMEMRAQFVCVKMRRVTAIETAIVSIRRCGLCAS